MPEMFIKIKSPVKAAIKKIIEMNGAIVSINNPNTFSFSRMI
jgi:hypothetical protein